jgi:hypothetical protein
MNLTKNFTLEKSIAIDELKVALKKATKELYPSELVDVVEEFIENISIDELTMKYEHFRLVKDAKEFVGSELKKETTVEHLPVISEVL